jgi:uncharacterized protein (DUF1810 family)
MAGNGTPADPFGLERFVAAQEPVYATVLDELRAGAKRTHWMWFVFPQLAELGRSAMARHFGLQGADEARAYLVHPLLGARLRECCDVLLQLPAQRTAQAVFGPTDEMKLRSCLTLFGAVAPQEPVFERGLARFFGGAPDPLTLDLLGRGSPA